MASSAAPNEFFGWGPIQIPEFGDWETANQLPITQYFECARQAGLLRCSCSLPEEDCPYGLNFDDMQIRRSYEPKIREPSFSRDSSSKKQRNQGMKQSSGQRSSFTVMPADEDLYKISPAVLRKTKRKKMLGFLSRCMAPPCSA